MRWAELRQTEQLICLTSGHWRLLMTHKDLCLCLRVLSSSPDWRSQVSPVRLSAFPSYVVPKCLNSVLPLIAWCLDGHLDSNGVTVRRRVWFVVTMHTGFCFVFGAHFFLAVESRLRRLHFLLGKKIKGVMFKLSKAKSFVRGRAHTRMGQKNKNKL